MTQSKFMVAKHKKKIKHLNKNFHKKFYISATWRYNSVESFVKKETTMERTFTALKPDAIKRGLMGAIINKIENKGYKIVALKLTNVSVELASKHYEEHKDKPFYNRLISYITSGPVLAMVLEGDDVISGLRHIVGKTNPNEAEAGSIRADFCTTKEYNVIHASDCTESAKREIALWFDESEICDNYKTALEILMEA